MLNDFKYFIKLFKIIYIKILKLEKKAINCYDFFEPPPPGGPKKLIKLGRGPKKIKIFFSIKYNKNTLKFY